MRNYQQHLKHKYRSMKYVSQDEMLDCFSIKYTELSLKRRGFLGDYSVTLHEVLDVDKSRYNIDVILFKGNPGMGKSMLAINICKQWAEGNLLQDHDAVILLLLRDPEIQKAKSISDLLLILDDDMRKGVFKEIVKSNGERICFILEGYDELPKKCMNEFSLFSKLKEKLAKCTLVCTSRPEACHYIETSFSTVIFIDGFNKESVDRYISSTFENVKNGKELANTLKSQLRNYPVVENILYVPINLALICLIFFHFSTLPETLTELYTLLCLRLILRHIVTRTPNVQEVEKLTSLKELPKSISEQFLQLCFLAYKGMERKNIIFHFQDLRDIGVDENKMSCLGLLQVTATTSVYGREKSYNFRHLTLQEFCAAWYISKLSAGEQMKLSKIYCYDDQFEMVWKFYSGITGLKDREILNLMLPYKLAKSESTKIKMIKMMYYVYEAHNDEVCKIVGDHCDGSFADLYPKHLRFVTYSFNNHKVLLQVFSYFLIHYKGMLKLIDLRKWPFITDTELTIIVNSLEKRWRLLNNVTSDELIFKLPLKRITSQSYSLLVNCLTQQYPIVELHINGEFLCTPNFDVLSTLTKSNTLRILDISCIKIGCKEAACLANCRNILLQDLRMRWCDLSPMEANLIGEMLACNKSITSIDLSSNHFKDEGVERIVYHLKYGSVLQCINLCGNHITAAGINHLIMSKLLEMNTTLTSLDLSHNDLKYEDVCLLLSSLTITMEYIGLYGYKFIHKAIAATQAVHKVKSFGFAYYDIDDPLINTATVIQQLVVKVTSEKVHHRMTKVIPGIDNIKELKINYCCVMNPQMMKSMSAYLRNVHSESLVIDVQLQHPGTTLKLIKLLISNTSFKKIKCSLWRSLKVTLLQLQELFKIVPDTLQELTLASVELCDEQSLLNLDHMLQKINELRSSKGVSNPLEVNIFYERREGFDIDLHDILM